MLRNILKINNIRFLSTYTNIKSYNNTIKNTDKALTIRPDSYYDKSFFDIEKKNVFEDSWVPVGYTNQFNTNNIISTKAHNIPIIITKNNKENIQAFYNVCRHRGCKLVNKDNKSKVIACPYHKWIYSLNGDLMGTPMYKPDNNIFDKKDYSLYPIKTEICNNIIFANLNNNTNTNAKNYYNDAFKILDDYPLKNCTIAKEKEYKINANWKLLIDNFIEYYHLPGVHPKLVKNSGMDEHVCTQEEGMYIGFKTDPLKSSGVAIDIDQSKPFTNLSKENKNAAHFQMLFPNMFYFLFPNHMFSVIIEPISPTKSIEKAILLVEPGSNQQWINELWEFYDEVNLEDIHICENVQEGISCNVYNGGRMVPKFETTIHRFHKMIIQQMTKSKTFPSIMQ